MQCAKISLLCAISHAVVVHIWPIRTITRVQHLELTYRASLMVFFLFFCVLLYLSHIREIT